MPRRLNPTQKAELIAKTRGEVDGWRPISSAPKDGQFFLAARFTGEKRNHDGLMAVDRWHERKRGDSYDGLGKFNEQFWPATHWMPLPPAPGAVEGAR